MDFKESNGLGGNFFLNYIIIAYDTKFRDTEIVFLPYPNTPISKIKIFFFINYFNFLTFCFYKMSLWSVVFCSFRDGSLHVTCIDQETGKCEAVTIEVAS